MRRTNRWPLVLRIRSSSLTDSSPGAFWTSPRTTGTSFSCCSISLWSTPRSRTPPWHKKGPPGERPTPARRPRSSPAGVGWCPLAGRRPAPARNACPTRRRRGSPSTGNAAPTTHVHPGLCAGAVPLTVRPAAVGRTPPPAPCRWGSGHSPAFTHLVRAGSQSRRPWSGFAGRDGTTCPTRGKRTGHRLPARTRTPGERPAPHSPSALDVGAVSVAGQAPRACPQCLPTPSPARLAVHGQRGPDNPPAPRVYGPARCP
jgi:hypothetical protein